MLRIHPLTRSHCHTVTRTLCNSVTHSFIHSLIRSLTTHSYIPSFMHSVMSTADHQCEWPISQRARRWHGQCPRRHQRGRRRLLSTPLPHLDLFDAEESACWLNGSDYIAACYQMTWSMSPMSSAWSALSIVSAIVRLPHINVFDVVVVVVVVVVD